MTNETLSLLAGHGDTWCLDLTSASRFLTKRSDKSANADDRSRRLPRANGTVAIIPLYGVLTKRGMDTWDGFVEGTDTIARTVDAAMAHQNISGVILDVDSPGGSSYGLMEFADRLHAYRSHEKPLVAVANPVAASAAIWSASSAKTFAVTPSGEVGSVGVWSLHMDYSKMLDSIGLKPTFIFAGDHKVDGNPYEPLKDDVKASMQESVDETYADFLSAMARNRGVTRSRAKAEFGEGRMLSPKKAMEVGLVDRVATLEDVLRGMKATGAIDGRHLEANITEHLCNVWTDKANAEPEPVKRGSSVEVVRARRIRERERVN